MTLLVDGYNLYFTGLRPGSKDKNLDRIRSAVIDAVAAYRVKRPVRAVIYFDGGRGERHMPQLQRIRGTEVKFSKSYGRSDEDIVNAVDYVRHPGDVCVVTSDVKLGESVRRLGASVISSREFVERLSRLPKDKDAPPDDEPAIKYNTPDSDEVDYWLKVFSGKKGQRRLPR